MLRCVIRETWICFLALRFLVDLHCMIYFRERRGWFTFSIQGHHCVVRNFQGHHCIEDVELVNPWEIGEPDQSVGCKLPRLPSPMTRGGSRKTPRGVMNRSGAPTYTKNSKTQRISTTLFRWCTIFCFLFSYFFKKKSDKPVVPLAGSWCLWLVPLLGRWCSWQACGGPDKYVVSLGSSVVSLLGLAAPDKPVVPLAGLWCPRPQGGGGHDPCDPPPLDPSLLMTTPLQLHMRMCRGNQIDPKHFLNLRLLGHFLLQAVRHSINSGVCSQCHLYRQEYNHTIHRYSLSLSSVLVVTLLVLDGDNLDILSQAFFSQFFPNPMQHS